LHFIIAKEIGKGKGKGKGKGIKRKKGVLAHLFMKMKEIRRKVR